MEPLRSKLGAADFDTWIRPIMPIAGADGWEIAVNEMKIVDNDLERVFRSAFTRDKDTQVVIKADTGVNHGRVVAVMEVAKQVGLTRLAIQTRGN